MVWNSPPSLKMETTPTYAAFEICTTNHCPPVIYAAMNILQFTCSLWAKDISTSCLLFSINWSEILSSPSQLPTVTKRQLQIASYQESCTNVLMGKNERTSQFAFPLALYIDLLEVLVNFQTLNCTPDWRRLRRITMSFIRGHSLWLPSGEECAALFEDAINCLTKKQSRTFTVLLTVNLFQMSLSERDHFAKMIAKQCW